jgi:H+/Cl- antiporter ClcA
MVAGIVADQVGMAWGVHHMHYAIGEVVAVTPWSVGAVVIAGVIFGLVGLVFATATHQLGGLVKRWIFYPPLRPMLGGIVIALAL